MATATHTFLDQIALDANLPSQATQILDASGARTPETIMSLLASFPSLSRSGLLDAPRISSAVMQRAGAGVASMLSVASAASATTMSPRRAPQAPGYGANAPNVALFKPQQVVPLPAAAPPGGVPGIASAAVIPSRTDVRGCLPWPVRDQGKRGTCVAFGTTALREQLLCEQQAATQDLSEQFLYYDIKTNSSDPRKTSDGTWIEYAFESLNNAGICPEATWPYNPAINATSVSQGPPPQGASNQAMALQWTAAVRSYISAKAGNAQVVLNALASGRPVAVSLPVFSDPTNLQVDNWSTPAGWLYGVVIDPPPTSIAIGGHCVCVTGFEPDATEPLGGYFVIRNSWSTNWGQQLPQPGYHGPEAGYGQISASYVDAYLWEYGQL
jgi:C1A family cysteine protease